MAKHGSFVIRGRAWTYEKLGRHEWIANCQVDDDVLMVRADDLAELKTKADMRLRIYDDDTFQDIP